MRTSVTDLLGIEVPIIQAGMSWASSGPELPLAVSRAGALGVIAAGPMYPDALRAAIKTVRAGTDRPFAVNVPLYNKRAHELLDITYEEKVPILIAAQGGPRQHLRRFKDAGVKWIHVTAAVEHARKAEAAGVDAVIVVGAEAGGHPPPDEVGAIVVVRAVCKAVGIPVIAGGGVADGAGMAAMFCLGAHAVQLGTRFLLTREANVHANYKAAALRAGIADTTLAGRGGMPIRTLRNALTERLDAARTPEVAAQLFAAATLKAAALEGDTDNGKVEIGQCVGLIDELVPAERLVRQLMAEFRQASQSLARCVGG